MPQYGLINPFHDSHKVEDITTTVMQCCIAFAVTETMKDVFSERYMELTLVAALMNWAWSDELIAFSYQIISESVIFENLFDTHPPVDKRVDALVRYAGGHDPGPLAVPQYDGEPALQEQAEETQQGGQERLPDSPFGPSNAGGKPFLPQRPPIELGTPSPGSPASGSSDPGPWGPHGGSTR